MNATPLRPGYLLENALWLDGRETAEQLERFKREVADALQERADADNVLLSPPEWTIKRPGEDRVPQVPAHISGPDVRLLVCETLVLAVKPQIVPGSFLGDLDPKDLMRLRQITRRAHQKHNPGAKMLTLEECDTIIEQLGPESAAKCVKAAVDTRTLH